MNEKDFKRLIEKSELQTSDHFTDQLMQKIEAPGKPATPSHFWSFRQVSITVLVLCGLTIFIGLSLLDISMLGSKLLLFVPSAFTFLLALNHFILLKRWSSAFPQIQET